LAEYRYSGHVGLQRLPSRDAGRASPIVTVVMPAYRLHHVIADSIKAVRRVLDASGYSYELIVVDDGSPDDTYVKALEESDGDVVRVYRLPVNMGKGYALIHGFKKSRGEVVVFFDGDLDIDPRQVTLLVDVITRGNIDVAITSKWHPLSKTTASVTRRLLSHAFYTLVRVLTGLKVGDTQTGAKAFRRRVLESIVDCITVKRYAFDVELLLATVVNGYSIVEVPAVWGIRLTSRFKVREVARMLVDLLAITYRHRVRKQYTSCRKT